MTGQAPGKSRGLFDDDDRVEIKVAGAWREAMNELLDMESLNTPPCAAKTAK
jgi:hypothetical protein